VITALGVGPLGAETEGRPLLDRITGAFVAVASVAAPVAAVIVLAVGLWWLLTQRRQVVREDETPGRHLSRVLLGAIAVVAGAAALIAGVAGWLTAAPGMQRASASAHVIYLLVPVGIPAMLLTLGLGLWLLAQRLRRGR
jgi:uncharacterized membrane protein YidH (DUF202 family)